MSFGYFNKIPLRKKDYERMNEKIGMRSVFSKLTGDETSDNLLAE